MMIRQFTQSLRRTSKLAFRQIPMIQMAFSSTMRQSLSTKPMSFFSTHTPPQPQTHHNSLKSSYEGNGFYVEQMLVGCLAIYSYYI